MDFVFSSQNVVRKTSPLHKMCFVIYLLVDSFISFGIVRAVIGNLNPKRSDFATSILTFRSGLSDAISSRIFNCGDKLHCLD